MKEKIINFIENHRKNFIEAIPFVSIIATILGVGIQLYFLIKLDSVQFFSWTRVLSDFVIVFGILMLLISIIGILCYTVSKKRLKIVLFIVSYIILISLSLNTYTRLLSSWIFPVLVSFVIIVTLVKIIFLSGRKIRKYDGWRKIFNPFIKGFVYAWFFYAIIFIIVSFWMILKTTGEYLDNTYQFNFTYESSIYINGNKYLKPMELVGVYSNGDYVFSKVIKNEGNKKYDTVIVIPTGKVEIIYKKEKIIQ